MASCAACLQSILQSQRFVLDGTEVFHAACVRQSYRSKLRIVEQRSLSLERQLEDTRRAAARVEDETNRHRNESTSRGAEVISLTGLLSGTRATLFATEDRLTATQNELRASRAEVSALRAELAAQKSTPTEGQNSEVVDDTVQRFRMLELD